MALADLTPAQQHHLLTHIREEPVEFVREVLDFTPWSRQEQIINAVIRDGERRVAVRSCHGSGKTATAAVVVLTYLAAFPGARVITTAPTWRQVKDLLWTEIGQRIIASDGFFPADRLTATELKLGPGWMAIGLSTDKPERFQGHHAERLLLVVDEASGVDDAIYEAAEGYMTSAGAQMLLIGNPTKTSGQFFRAFHSERAGWYRVHISAMDTPLLTGEIVPDKLKHVLPTKKWVEESLERFGPDSAAYAVRVLGNFPSQSEASVVSMSLLERAMQHDRSEHLDPWGTLRVGADIAIYQDDTVIATRLGGRIDIARAFNGKDTIDIAGAIVQEARKLRDEAQALRDATPEDERPKDAKPIRVTISVDTIGMGQGVVDQLRRMREPWMAIDAHNGSKKAVGGRQAEETYTNRRSQTWFSIDELLKADLISLPNDDALSAELLSAQYDTDSAGRLRVGSKDAMKKLLGGRSPDRADAVLLTCCPLANTGRVLIF